jgi:hypothetical protein
VDIAKLQNLSKEEIRNLIDRAQELCMAAPEKLAIPARHYWAGGVYAREITLPKDSIVIGKIHKFENLNVLSSGKLSLISIDGIVTVEAPYTIVSSPGVKRMAYAHEDSVWTVFHATEEKDVDKIEEHYTTTNYNDLIEQKEKVCLTSS